MAVTRRAYAGGSVQTTIPLGITGTPASFDLAVATGWPTGASFYVVVDPDLSAEEKILVTRSGVTCTVVTRGVDGTSSTNHAAGAACYPCITAADLDEANRLAAIMTTQGDIILGDATGNPARLARGSSGLPLVAGASTLSYAQLGTAGIADLGVTAAKIANDTITAAQIAPNAIAASELADNAVDTAAIVDLAVSTAKLADLGVTAAKIANDTITAAQIAVNAIGSSELADNAVDTAAIAALAVTTAKITGRTLAWSIDTADRTTTSASYVFVAGCPDVTPTFVAGRIYEFVFSCNWAGVTTGYVGIEISGIGVAAEGFILPNTGPIFVRYISSALVGALQIRIVMKTSSAGTAAGYAGAGTKTPFLTIKDIT